tara:strand:+ start:9646 stop:10176 length:531 start_codon:yes stop_codon:yes gene_type:complete
MIDTTIPAKFIESYQTHDDALNDREGDLYNDSPFRVYKEMSSKRKGKFFEKLVSEYCKHLGFAVTRPKQSEYDRIINGRRVEIKGSMLWGGGDQFRWQQIRTGQDYDVIIFLAMYPDRVEMYSSTKQEVDEFVSAQDENGFWKYNQHGGKTVNSGTFFLDGFPKDFPFMKSLYANL